METSVCARCDNVLAANHPVVDLEPETCGLLIDWARRQHEECSSLDSVSTALPIRRASTLGGVRATCLAAHRTDTVLCWGRVLPRRRTPATALELQRPCLLHAARKAHSMRCLNRNRFETGRRYTGTGQPNGSSGSWTQPSCACWAGCQAPPTTACSEPGRRWQGNTPAKPAARSSTSTLQSHSQAGWGKITSPAPATKEVGDGAFRGVRDPKKRKSQ